MIFAAASGFVKLRDGGFSLPRTTLDRPPRPPARRSDRGSVRAGQQREVGQLRDAAGNAVARLVQTIDGPLGKYGRATAGPGQQRIDDTARASARCHGSDVDLQVGQGQAAIRPSFASHSSMSPPRQWSAAFRAKGRSGQDERRAATFAGRPDRRRRTARPSPTVGNGAQSNGSSTIARERASFAASRPATPIRSPTARAFRSARRPTGSVSPPNSRGGEAARAKTSSTSDLPLPLGPISRPSRRRCSTRKFSRASASSCVGLW